MAWSARVGPATARAGRKPTSASAAAGGRRGFETVTSLPGVLVNPVAAVVGRRQEGEVRRDARVVQVHAVADMVVVVVLAHGRGHDPSCPDIVLRLTIRIARVYLLGHA